MNEVIINRLIVPTFEVMAKVLSNPLIEVVPKVDTFTYWSPILIIVAPIIAALFTYWLTIRGVLRSRGQEEKGIRAALKYEIFLNVAVLIDSGRIAENISNVWIRNNQKSRDIRPQLRFIAFEAMIKNNLLSAVEKDKDKIYILYNRFEQYKLALDNYFEELRAVIDSQIDTKDSKDSVGSIVDEIKRWARTLENSFETDYLSNISLLSKNSWKEFNFGGNRNTT